MIQDDIKIYKNKKTAFYRYHIRTLTRALHLHLQDLVGKPADKLYNKRYMAERDKYTYLVFYKGKVIGIFTTTPQLKIIFIWRLYIKPEYRNKGIGSYIMKWIDNKYPNQNLMLELDEGNSHAEHVYKKLGYKPCPYDKSYLTILRTSKKEENNKTEEES